MSNANTQPKVIKDQFGNLVLAPTGMATGSGQLSNVGSSATSPAGAAVGGANPDAAKMAGTPNQTSAPTILPQAARIASEGRALRDVVRDEASTASQQPQMSEQQAKKVEDGARYQKQFGDLGSRVQNLIASALAPPTPIAAPTAPIESTSTADALAASLPGGGAAPATAQKSPLLTGAAQQLTPQQQGALSAYATNPSVETYAAAKQALGGGDPNQYIPASDSTSIAKQLAGATPDQIRMSNDVLEQMGYDAATVAEVLGVDPAALPGMTLEQFQAAIDSHLQGDQSEVAKWMSVLNDPATGPNERAAARAQLSQMGVSGVYASSQEVDALRQSVQDADTVEFNGQQYTVEELLSDDAISGVITNYLDDPKFAATLKEREPRFAAYIDQHQAALRELALHTTESAKQFDEVSTANADIKSKLGVAGMDDATLASILEAMSPGSSSEYATSKINLAGLPGLQLLTDTKANAAAKQAGIDPTVFIKNLTALAKISPDSALELASMPLKQIVSTGAGISDQQNFNVYINHVRNEHAWAGVNHSDPEAMIHFLFGKDMSLAEAKTEAAHLKEVWPKGGDPDHRQEMLDANRDGKLDSPAQIAKNIEAAMKKNPFAGDSFLKFAKGQQTMSLLDTLRAGKDAGAAEYMRLLKVAQANGFSGGTGLPGLESLAEQSRIFDYINGKPASGLISTSGYAAPGASGPLINVQGLATSKK